MYLTSESPVVKGAKNIIHETPGFIGASPYEFTNPRHELLGARESAWIGVYLDSMLPRFDIVGPDATKVLNMFFVNRDYGKLKVGGSRHALQCDENGYIMQSGIIGKISDNHFRSYNIFPFLPEDSGFDVKWEMVPDFFIQIDGPKSLQILEHAFQKDFHDLKFARNTTFEFKGHEIYLHRIGMSGALAYELHGSPEIGEEVYTTIVEAGEKYDIRRLGSRQYCSNHTPGGYPNPAIHFGVTSFGPQGMNLGMTGSANEKFENYLMTPYDVGWGYLVNFDHDFTGKDALSKIAEKPRYMPVTLLWNTDDVGHVVACEISDPEMAANERIMDFNQDNPEFTRMHADWVYNGAEKIGIASGRVIDYYSNHFMSLGFIAPDAAEEGKELEILWGSCGNKQMKIRATIAKFPFYDGEYRNETFDVEKIPRA